MSKSFVLPPVPAGQPGLDQGSTNVPGGAETRPVPAYVALAERILAEPDVRRQVDLLEELGKLLPETDGVPLETPWHRLAINLMDEVLSFAWRDRDDFYVGGNMFIYYSMRQIMNEDFIGPDFFYVAGVERRRPRPSWMMWEEGKAPDLIVELLSPTTAERDRTEKKAIYEQKFHTPEYFCYDPQAHQLEGWRFQGTVYQPIVRDERGWMWSEVLKLWLGNWTGEFQGRLDVWLRFYDSEGNLVLLEGEAERWRAEAERQRAEAEHQRAEAERQRAEAERQRADAEHQRAEAERQRAEAAEAELARLKALP